MKKIVGVSLGLLALSGIARGDGGEDAGATDGGADAGADATPEPINTVCLCTLHVSVAEPEVLPAAPEPLDTEAIRARVLASLPPDLRGRV